ncbi:capsid cement protein [Thioclava sp. GXIMD2076]|uniref:capsid cement protein n=1 Tax=unclassified Thioclava TaxID=2621713 RepID=UPI0030D38F9A
MKGYYHKGDSVAVIAPYDVTASEPVRVGVLFGLTGYAAAEGQEVEITRQIACNLPKPAALAIAAGAALYWDAEAKVLTTEIGAEGAEKPLVGAALTDATAGSAVVFGLLDGTIR